MNNGDKMLNLVKRIQALSENGQHYAESDYDMDRYQEMEKIALEMTAILTDAPPDLINLNMKEMNGYRTPKVDVRAVVFNDQNEILMVKEEIDGNWSLPGGWADVGFTPAEIAEKETYEEAGAKVKAERLLAVMDKRCHDHPPDIHYAYKIFIECSLTDSRLKTGFETSAAGFFSLHEIPTLSTPRNTLKQIEIMYEYHLGVRKWAHLDLSEECI